MVFTGQDLAELVDRARSIYERLDQGRAHATDEPGEPAADEVLERWCRIAARGDWPTFEKRLQWDGLDLRQARSILRSTDPSPEVPAWSETLNAMLAEVAAYAAQRADISGTTAGYRFLKHDHPLPFEDILVPFVSHASRQVASRAGSDYDLFAGEAHAAVERALLRSLADLFSRTLMAEFSAFRESRATNGRALYQAFVTELLQDQLRTFLREYSVLARLAAIVVDSWIDATHELLVRLGADRVAIRASFNVPGELGPVVSLVPSLSDPHNRRRFVVALTFQNGFRLVYKPRDLRLELAFQQLLGWLNAHGLSPAMKTLTVFTRAQYGWVEFVEQASCEGEDAARAYFGRMGTLLCLGYVFDGVDLHHENIMTSGAHPVVVDAETFFYPKPRPAAESRAGAQALRLANEQVRGSVLKTGMLPETRLAADGVCWDVSALGSGAQMLPGRTMHWQQTNTDAMRYDMVMVEQAASTQVPPSEPYLDDLIKGFEQTYRLLLEQRDNLLGEEGPLRRFANLPVRFMIRPTRIYGVLLLNGYHPRYLRNGIERSIALDAMSVGFLREAQQPYMWPVVQAEHRALEQLDIPRFTAVTDETWLATSAQERIGDCFPETGYRRALTRLRELEYEDMHRQISFVRGAFQGRRGNGHEAANGSRFDVEATPVDGSEELTAELALQECRKIAALLDSLAVRSDDGTASWIGLSCVLPTKQAAVRLLDMGLYDGISGIALFLAALARVSGDAAWRDLARAAVVPLQFTLRDDQIRERACKRVGIGGGFGTGSLIYSLVAIAQLLDDPELIEDAARAATTISASRVQDDEALDIILGSAGALLGLLKLHQVAGSASVLEQARTCANHILSRQIQSGEQRGAWPGVEPRALSSLSHGAAGVAYALTRLYEVTGDAALIRAARAAVTFEERLFVPDARNWSRTDAAADRLPAALRATWCQGAPGIALARLGMLAALTDSRVRADLDAALHTTAAHAVSNVDHLCCGNLGRADVLFTAGRQLARPDLQHAALHNAWRTVTRAQRVGTWAIAEQGGPYRHGFFQGRSGIGYALLRLTHPEVLPAVLMWG
jgi:type 2 lantibiotic biosynthesis protein LanM